MPEPSSRSWFQVEESFWKVTPEVRQRRLQKYTVPLEDQVKLLDLWGRHSSAFVLLKKLPRV